jgi:Amt family ammonium transporter
VLGYSDYAGSGTVHLLGAAAALGVVTLLGPRAGKYGADGSINPLPGSNIPLAALGVLILWLGWFGFNGGSQLAMGTTEDAIAVSTIFINTFLAGAGGVIGAAIITRLHFGKTDVIQMLNGCIGGLVAVTAEPLAPSPLAAILIGAVGGLIVVYGTKLLFSLKIDDVVGAVPAHLFAGIWGTLIVPATNSDAVFSAQLIGVLSVNIFVFIVAYIVFSFMKATVGLRLSKEGETKGTDVTETGVIAYAIRD